MNNNVELKSNQEDSPESETNLKRVDKKLRLTPVIDNFELAVSLWWKNLKKFLLIYWQGLKPALIPIGILLILYIIKQEAGLLSYPFFLVYILLTAVAYLFALYFITRAQIAIFLFIKNGFLGEIDKLYKDSKNLFWPYIGLSLLTAILIILWTFLFIIPGIIYSVFYVFAIYVFFCEGKKGMDAIRRSKNLVSGHFWPVFGRILFLLLVTIIFVSIIALPLSPLPKESAAYTIWNFIMQIINIIVAPVYIIFFYKIYNDLVKMKK